MQNMISNEQIKIEAETGVNVPTQYTHSKKKKNLFKFDHLSNIETRVGDVPEE